MVYDFILKETKIARVPVAADSEMKASAIFDKWYNKHISDPKDSTIYDLLDDGSGGIEITRSPGKPESEYNPEDIMLPEEKGTPEEPVYDLFIQMADQPERIVHKIGISLSDVADTILNYAEKFYLLPNYPLLFGDKKETFSLKKYIHAQ